MFIYMLILLVIAAIALGYVLCKIRLSYKLFKIHKDIGVRLEKINPEMEELKKLQDENVPMEDKKELFHKGMSVNTELGRIDGTLEVISKLLG